MKYNNTLEKFKSILNNTKYSNLYNYCGIPSYLNNTNKATSQTINNQTIKNESKIENINQSINNQTIKNESTMKKETNNTINNLTVKNESKIDNDKNETNPNVNNQTEKAVM